MAFPGTYTTFKTVAPIAYHAVPSEGSSNVTGSCTTCGSPAAVGAGWGCAAGCGAGCGAACAGCSAGCTGGGAACAACSAGCGAACSAGCAGCSGCGAGCSGCGPGCSAGGRARCCARANGARGPQPGRGTPAPDPIDPGADLI